MHAPSEEESDDSKNSFCEELEQVFCHCTKNNKNILLGGFNAKLGREEIFKPTIWNESLHQDSNDNGVRIVNFGTSKNLALKNMILSHRNLHKYSRTSPDGKNHEQNDHILIDRRGHSGIPDVRSFCLADCDIDQNLVVAKLSERLALCKQATQAFDVKRLNLRKLSELEVRKQYNIKI